MSDDTTARARQIMLEDLQEVVQQGREISASLFNHMLKRCESPIEVLMLGALAFGLNRELYTEQTPVPGFASRPSDMTGLWIMPQFEILRYRVDFLVVNVCEHAPKLFTCARVVVECDGHDFHDKTPEQAERDKSRDRTLVGAGLPVLRFTGREIVRDPRACADDVARALNAEAQRQLKAMIDAGSGAL